MQDFYQQDQAIVASANKPGEIYANRIDLELAFLYSAG